MRKFIRYFFLAVIWSAIMLAFCAANAQTKQQVVTISRAANKFDIDPRIMVAIAKVESNFNEKAIGQLGEVGIFQLRPEMHANVHTPAGNALAAAKYLSQLRKQCGAAYISCYNTGPYHRSRNPQTSAYYLRVMKAYGDGS